MSESGRLLEDAHAAVLGAEDLWIDLRAHEVRLGEKPIELTPKEFALLVVLVRNSGIVLTLSQLLDLVWGEPNPNPHTLRMHIQKLRAKIETDPKHATRIETVWGVGYRYRKG